MNLVIFGGTGGTGLCLIDQALQQGHTVTAFVRSPEKLGARREQVRIAQGDVLDPAKVDAAVAAQDAVLSALGVKPGIKEHVLSHGTRNIIASMQNHRVRRLIVESSYGVAESYSQATMPARIVFSTLLKGIYEDKARQEAIIRESPLDWVIVRPPRLTDGPLTGKYRVETHMRLGVRDSISRADVAGFMLNCLVDSKWLRESPALAY